ncbi:MAG: hypothetical protein ABI564_15805, partial [Ideonella sp.]
MSRPSADTTAATAASPPISGSVRRRHLFYISGFDPKGPAHYHRLFTEQAALAGAIGGYRIEVGGRRRASAHSAVWTLRHFTAPAPAEADVESVFEFLRWDDIVRTHWSRNPAVLAWQLVCTTLLYLRSGALWTMLKLAWPPVLALVAPFLLLIGLLLSLPTAWLLATWVATNAGSWWPGVLAGIGVLGGAAGLALWVERTMNVQWLLRSYAFTGLQGSRGVTALEDRLDHFGRRIVERMQSTPACDEVLIVAHSSGSIMATAALARALRLDPQLGARGPRLSLLTLGQWSPLLSSLPSAQRFRDELASVAAEPALDWVDVSAPPDGCCFALTDPVAAAGLPVPRPDHPRLLSPRFAELFSATRYAAIRRDRFRLHFQYLMAGERAGER